MKKNAAIALISFAVLKCHECLSFHLPFELTVEIPVQMHLELEVNLLVHNVIEREIEREKVQMKPPLVAKGKFPKVRWSFLVRSVAYSHFLPLLLYCSPCLNLGFPF